MYMEVNDDNMGMSFTSIRLHGLMFSYSSVVFHVRSMDHMMWGAGELTM
jgi:hypothetical protein